MKKVITSMTATFIAEGNHILYGCSLVDEVTGAIQKIPPNGFLVVDNEVNEAIDCLKSVVKERIHLSDGQLSLIKEINVVKMDEEYKISYKYSIVRNATGQIEFDNIADSMIATCDLKNAVMAIEATCMEK